MAIIRKIMGTLRSKPTIEGAGVNLKRVFGYPEVPLLDPFLLLDDLHSDDPDDYMAGFPWHPHRGIETVTYVLHGRIRHGDSLGNGGIIEAGDVQWMTAGNGIIHEEMPLQNKMLQGFQLWVSLPASHKMMDPRYRDVKKDDIPEITLGDTRIKIICGEVAGTKGPAQDIVINPEYLDVAITPGGELAHPVERGHKVFAYVIEGNGYFAPMNNRLIKTENLVIYADGDEVRIKAGDNGLRFLLVSGKPIGETVAWRGPIVMNTQSELQLAFEEYRNGTFIKHPRSPQ